MARFGGYPGMGGGNMNQLLKQAQKMQADMLKTQESIEAKEIVKNIYSKEMKIKYVF